MPERHDEHQVLTRDHGSFERIVLERAAREGQIDLSACELEFECGPVVLREAETYVRMGRGEAADERRHVLDAERAQKAQCDRARRGVRHVRQLAATGGELIERALDPAQEDLAVARQADRAADAVEQRDAQLAL